MKKNNFLPVAILAFTIIFLIFSCNKNDLSNAKSLPKSSKEASFQITSDSIRKDSINAHWALSPKNTFEKPLSALSRQKEPFGNRTTSTYGCGSYFTDYYYGTGFYRYPAYTLDLSSTPEGSTISISVGSYDIPNRFTIYDANGNLVTATEWMGYVSYSGPWGSSLNTPENKILTFIKGAVNSYSLVVETSTQDYSDSWETGVSCTVPIDITNFLNSPEYSSFSSLNQAIVSKVKQAGAKVRNDVNQVLNESLKTVHLPVIETNGDTSGVIIGVPDVYNGVTKYLIFYQNNQLVTRSSTDFYYGEVGFDLFNSNTSFSVKYNANDEFVSDTLIPGPRWIANGQTSMARSSFVWPSWDCVDNVMDKFSARCTGGCRLLCRVSDTFGFGTCTGGQYIGAATWCARNNNNHSLY